MSYPSLEFRSTTAPAGCQPISESSATQNHPLGMIIKAFDQTYGEGEFIYLKGVASTAAGDLCCFNQAAGTSVRSIISGTGSSGPCGVAMSANVASQYGWYQIGGAGPVKAATVSANTSAFITATAGQIDDLASVGNRVDGMLIKAADSGGFATCQFNGPAIVGDGGESGTNTGDVTVGAIGSTPGANGSSLASQVLTLQPADATYGGVVTAVAQTFAGAKSLVTGQPTTPASGTGITVNSSGELRRGAYKVTIGRAAWTANAQTQDITLAVIPAKCRILYAYADVTEKYAGPAGTLALTMGISAGGAGMLVSFDVKTAIVLSGLLDADMGTAMVAAAMVQGAYTPSFTATTTISVRLTSGTGDIATAGVTNLTTGITTFYLGFENL